MEQGVFAVSGKRVVVVGAARSGVAAAELLARRGASVMLTEARPAFEDADRLRAAGVELELGGHRAETLAAADLIVMSPGVPVDQPVFDAARARGVEIMGELELASRFVKGRVIAITGTKGKSTTTTLVGRMLSAAGRTVLVGGNIGVPVSAQVDQSTPETLHVVEASSFQLETTSAFRPWIAVWLNVADDHLDRHPNMGSYVDAKARIFASQGADDWAVVNADDSLVMARSTATRARRVTFSLAGAADAECVVDGDWIVKRTATGRDRLLPVSAVELTGRHMLNNVLAAAAVSAIADVAPASMVAALQGFHGLEHVMEPAGEFQGVRFVNDSKATNIEAARRSIESFGRGVVAIIGGKFKGGDLRELREPLSTCGRAVIAIGEAAPLVREALTGVVPVFEAASMKEAVRRGYEVAAPDGVVLLAPACASFDWFKDYAERGRTFKYEVQQLQERSRC
ncbi:MAG: UDP-N-acetylmuramoyl-L-alanine--D-glutamate ligase [Acidobacteria bacterium]|nr:UDP-N-acetylmuramoyl-L-alanine--D-glutamate ligase [Acidobacteriota bacterium]